MRIPATLVLLLPLSACLSLDGFVYNPRHCSIVGPETCDSEGDDPWDDICVPCGEAYDWERDYPWMDSTLEVGQTIRPVPQDSVVQVTIETDDGRAELDAYWIPGHRGNAALADTTVIYNHGNYAGIEHYAPRVRMLHEWGVNVFVWDYRGYGKSMPAETPSAAEFLADARLVREVAEGFVPDPDRIVIYANSLGAIPAVEMALHDPGCALFLEAPFTSVSAIARANAKLSLGEQFLSEGRFDNIEKIRDYDGPLLAMIGELDNKFSPDDVGRIVDNAGGEAKELWVLPGVRHGIANVGVPEASLTAYLDRMDLFLQTRATGCLAP